MCVLLRVWLCVCECLCVYVRVSSCVFCVYVEQDYTGVIAVGPCGQGLKVQKLFQTKVFDKKVKIFDVHGLGPVEKPQFLAFSRVSCHFDCQLLNYQIEPQRPN